MSTSPYSSSHARRRRGATAVFAAITIPVMFGFTALVVDVGMLYTTRADLQRAADAAALAGVSAYFSDPGLGGDLEALTQLAIGRAQHFSQQNATLGKPTILDVADIALGRHDYDNPTGPLLASEPFNAVQVTVRRTPDSTNGPVPFIFAPIFGRFEGSVTATARAAMRDQLAGYRLEEYRGFIPFTVHEDIYEDMSLNGPDDYSYDDGVVPEGDDVPEIKLFPWKWGDMAEEVGDEGADGGGNFGTLNIGVDSQSASVLEDQIRRGISAEELEAEFGTSELEFYDDAGEPVTYLSNGNTGLSTSMKDTVNALIGDVVGFFIHREIYDNGSNATYVISGVRWGRIMDLHLTGNPSNRALVIQPVAYTDGNVVVSEFAPSTDGQVGRVQLVQ